MNEFELIDKISKDFCIAPKSGITGIGDDCAIIPQQNGYETLVSTDLLVEDSHFLFENISPYQLGWKSAAVNFSDIAAMGGEATASFLAFALPPKARGAWVEDFMRGYRDISQLYGFPLLGGDTTSAPEKVSICVTVLGRTKVGSAVKRSGAKPGDLICVSGPLGDSAAGLKIILDNINCGPIESFLVGRHYLPHPKMTEGQAFAKGGASSMMDISDGIASDLKHILKASGAGAVIDTEAIPTSKELRSFCEKYGFDPLDFALSGGEDYELLFTISPENEKYLSETHHIVGRIVPGSELEWKGSNKSFEGFTHF